MKLTEGQRKALAAIGRIGGSRKSEAKTRASRENGRKSGDARKARQAILKPEQQMEGTDVQ